MNLKDQDIKERAYEYCQIFVDQRIARIQDQITSIQQAFRSETKSSAGDKHETGRAMLQLEREKLGQQLAIAEEMKLVLAKVNIHNKEERVGLGSWVQTTEAAYFLAISAGEYKAEGVYCISVKTPIGQLVLGKKRGDTFMFQGKEHRVLEVK